MCYVVKDLVRHLTYRHTLEHIQVIHLIDVMYVVKDLVRMVAYRDTLEHIQVIFIWCITCMCSNVYL
jgi:hypothetical protein